MLNENKLRKEFEEWANRAFCVEVKVAYDHVLAEVFYTDPCVQWAWEGFLFGKGFDKWKHT